MKLFQLLILLLVLSSIQVPFNPVSVSESIASGTYAPPPPLPGDVLDDEDEDDDEEDGRI